MLICGEVCRLFVVGCIARVLGHRSHLSRVLRLGVEICQILLCRCIRKHRGRDPIRGLSRTGGLFCLRHRHFPLCLRLCVRILRSDRLRRVVWCSFFSWHLLFPIEVVYSLGALNQSKICCDGFIGIPSTRFRPVSQSSVKPIVYAVKLSQSVSGCLSFACS